MPIIKNKVFIYLFTRYATYALQFVLSLVIAVRLGPFYLGVYGMVNLIISYFGQVNFGIPHALNVFLVHNKRDRNKGDEYSFNALSIYSYVNIIIIIGAVLISLFWGCSWGDYEMGLFLPFIIAIAALIYYNAILTCILRVRNQINVLSLVGSIPVLLNSAIIWFFKEKELVLLLTIVSLLSCVITSLICIKEGVLPKRENCRINYSLQKAIFHKGQYLFLYNSCFYFILITIRTIISSNYSVVEFGLFTFSYTIANSVMMLLDSFNTIIFPKTLDLLSDGDKQQKAYCLEKMRKGYISSSHMLIYLAMIFFPVLIWLVPKYQMALTSMNMIALSILANTNSYGYSTMLIAENQEKKSAFISLISLIVNVIVGVILVVVFEVNFSYVIIATLIAYMVSSFLFVYEGDGMLLGQKSFKITMKHYFRLRMFIPYILAFIISCFNLEYLIAIPLVIYLLLNYRDLYFLLELGKKIVNKPQVVDI